MRGLGIPGLGLATKKGLGPSVPTMSMPSAGLVSLFSVVRPEGYAGSFADLRRTSDGATLTIGYTPGNVPDYAAADAWAAGSVVTVSKLYDASGNGNHWVAPDNASQPPFSRLNQINGLRPISFDSHKAGAAPKCLQVALAVALDRLNTTVYQMVSPRTATDGNSYFEGFTNANFTSSSALLYTIIGSLGLNFGTLRTWTKYPPTRMQTLSVSSGAARKAVRFDGAEKADFIVDAAGSIASMRIGKASPGGNYNAGLDLFCMAVYDTAHDSATTTANEAILNAAYSPKRSGWTKRLVPGTTSLRVGYNSTLNQNGMWQAGFGRPDRDVSEYELFNMAVGGRTLANEYNNDRTRNATLYDATKDAVIYMIGDPTNDIAALTLGSVAIAQAWASDFFGTTTGACAALGGPATSPIAIPFVTYLKALGVEGQGSVHHVPQPGRI
jgi:hypothetical protein